MLASRKFSGIGQLDVDHLGWVNPRELENGPLVHAVDSIFLLALSKETKIVPASTVKKKLAAAEADATKREGRPPSRKERKALKEQVLRVAAAWSADPHQADVWRSHPPKEAAARPDHLGKVSRGFSWRLHRQLHEARHATFISEASNGSATKPEND